jgi:2-polyprenyl-6-methoxyphenol hydroxylase-like FAD-dependent oxidoreductase
MDIDYDIIIAGGGIAGATLGLVASREGARVLIVEAEAVFRDRVRGEGLHPWGVAIAERLGVLDVLRSAPAQAVSDWDTYLGGMHVERKDLTNVTPSQLPGYNVHHPELETALLMAAEVAGAHVLRGAKVTRVEPGAPAAVELVQGDDRTRRSARLAVIADGRRSPLRKQLGIEMTETLAPLIATGVLLDGVSCDRSATSMFVQATGRALALIVALPRERVRLYLFELRSGRWRRFSGASDLSALLEHCVAIGVPPAALTGARAIGPLATFDTTYCSLRDLALPQGVTLLGDAAGNVEPAFGCGQSLALRDVKTLLDAFCECHDWQLSAARYIAERRAYHASLLRVEAWMTRILFTPSPEGDILRLATGPRLPQLGVDLFGAGPDSPSDAATEARLFEGLPVIETL